MNILSKLKNRKLGLIELMSMGFEVYIKNLKPILLVFSTINLSFLIIMLAMRFLLPNNPELSIFVFRIFGSIIFGSSLFICQIIYFIPIAIITNNYVYGRHNNYQSVVKKLLASLVPLFLLSLRFILKVFMLYLGAIITGLLLFLLLSLLNLQFHIYFHPVFSVLVSLVLIVLTRPVIIYIINNQYYGLAFLLRDQRGTAAFAYSRSIVKDNWWRVFFFSFLVMLLDFGLQQLFYIPFIIVQFIAIGIVIGSTLLFLNLDFHKKLDN
ncbi:MULTISPECIES: hypothetical protein [unclassified Moorena]|uniref:hypothetical protein n=1 Tax=unclassified Moorena TaxID=2683338 RepID=UPI0013FFB3B6|nr:MULTISPECIES: hypothetical protein [unclassified Moorena]NEO13188.1 hypothetical protein [Moorena sp. SIO3E8]NEQ01094.1 hypothetical protein [Moorena sp. SIO3F7]